MTLASILFTELSDDGTNIKAIAKELFLDVTISERPSFTSRLTTNPIEDGSVINDHVIDDPDTLVLEGLISDSKVKVLSGARDIVDKGFGSTARSKAAFDLLKDLKEGHEILSIHSGLTVYTDMVITQFIPTRTRRTGKALRFTLALQKVKRVKSKVTAIPAANIKNVHPDTKDQIQSTTDTGKQSTKAPTAKVQEDSSLAYSLLQGAGVVP